MTKNSAKKRAARGYQQANPGTTYPAALRAVEQTAPAADWTHGSTPWIRTIGRSPITCYFCGRTKAIRSSGDDKKDQGRIQWYCDNGNCDAREVEVIVLRDGHPATLNRADVTVLSAIAPAAHHPSTPLGEWDHWIPGATPWARTVEGPLPCMFCGQQAAIRSRGDDPSDCGRIQLYCDNQGCDVREAEVIVMRDGTIETMERPDVATLKEIDRPPVLRRHPGQIQSYTLTELGNAFANDDRVARRH